MPEEMGRSPTRTRHSRSVECAVDDHRDGTVRGEGTKGSATADKDRLGVGPRPAVLHVGRYRLPDLVGQRQSGLTAAFATDMNRGALPVDVAETELHN